MKLLALLLALAPFVSAQLQIDPVIAAEIAKIKAIDNHAHPVLPAAGDTEYDALPVEHMDPTPNRYGLARESRQPPKPPTSFSATPRNAP
jgi:hypothetical protein